MKTRTKNLESAQAMSGALPSSAPAMENGQAHTSAAKPLTLSSWSACQANTNPKQKSILGEFFAEHDFLVRGDRNGVKDLRERASLFLVAPGTTPNTVVKTSLYWMRDHWAPNPFTVKWYSLGALLPATLYDFKKENPTCDSAARLFLIPGEVDPQSETVTGKYPIEFLKQLNIRLNGSILSAYRFDMATGTAYFYFDNEVEVQRAGAMFYADDKYVFLDPSKFSPSGSPGYNVRDLLMTSQTVTIYTLTSGSDNRIMDQFKALCVEHLECAEESPQPSRDETKRLRLCIVGANSEPVTDIAKTGRVRLAGRQT